MGEWEPFMARDGHNFQAYLAPPAGRPRGAVVIVQEIFGVNAHIQSLVDRYAAAGFVAIAPALFDRVGKNLTADYSPEGFAIGRGYAAQLKRQDVLADLAAAINVVRHAGRVALIGFCWGGTMTWVGARTLPIACAVGYYVSRIGENLDDVPAVPMMLHFGARDSNIPLSDVDKTRQRFPRGIFHIYPADHGFNCDARANYDAPSAMLAWERTQEFLAQNVG